MTSSSVAADERPPNNAAPLLTIGIVVAIGSLVALVGSVGAKSVGGMAVHWWTVIVAFLVNWVAFAPSYFKRTEHFYDLVGSFTYVITTASASVLARTATTRGWLLATAGAAHATTTPKPPGLWAFIGLSVWTCGFGIEVVADGQKRRFRSDEANHDRFIADGLWT